MGHPFLIDAKGLIDLVAISFYGRVFTLLFLDWRTHGYQKVKAP